MKRKWLLILIALTAAAVAPSSWSRTSLRVGSKKFTESVLLGELITALVRDSGSDVLHQAELGGTRMVFNALLVREIDFYPEYTGTLRQEIFAGDDVKTLTALRGALAAQGVGMSQPLGFSNSYAMGMKEELAERLGIRTISDLKRHPELRFGFGSEFMDRGDGWPSLRDRYGLPQRNVVGMDHDVAYRRLDAGEIDAMDVYTTDANIEQYGIALLADDLHHFPDYEAVILYAADLAERAPQALQAVRRLEHRITDIEMRAMNRRVALERYPEVRVAAEFLGDKFSLDIAVREETRWQRIWKHSKEHLNLVRRSLAPAILVAIPLGIVAARRKKLGQIILATVGIIQTIPALALLVMLIKPLSNLGLSSIGAASAPALIALFLYSLLPIVRNTYTGLTDIPAPICESAAALGLSPFARLRLVELPMASRAILAGVKTAAVVNVGFATLGALIGAGGYGQPILTGIRLNDYALILEGAIPAAVLAVVVQGLFDLSERLLVPQGLRLKPTR